MVALGFGFGFGFGFGSGSGTRAEKRTLARATAGRSSSSVEIDPPALETFQKFAEEYPAERKPTGRDWTAAVRLWKGMSPREQADAVAALPNWKQFWSQDEPRFVPGMLKFLQRKQWQAPPPAAKERVNGKRPGSTTTEGHLARMRRNAKTLGLDRS
jgi:hypothetical protein